MQMQQGFGNGYQAKGGGKGFDHMGNGYGQGNWGLAPGKGGMYAIPELIRTGSGTLGQGPTPIPMGPCPLGPCSLKAALLWPLSGLR